MALGKEKKEEECMGGSARADDGFAREGYNVLIRLIVHLAVLYILCQDCLNDML